MSRSVDVRGYMLEVYRDPDDGSWTAAVPDLPGCVAAAATPAAAIELVEDAIAAWIEAAEAQGRRVPPPSPIEEEFSGRFVLRVAKSLHGELVRAARRDGVSLNAYCATALAQSVGAGQALTLIATAWDASRPYVAPPLIGYRLAVGDNVFESRTGYSMAQVPPASRVWELGPEVHRVAGRVASMGGAR